MKKVITLWLAVISVSVPAYAGFQLPRGVHTADSLQEARAEAVEKGKGLAFVLSNKGTNCGLCVAATEKAFKELKSHSVVVYLGTGEAKSWQAVGPLVMTGLQTKAMGNIIPKVAVTSPDMGQLWAQISYKDMGNDRTFRDTRKKVDAIQEGEAEPPDPKEMVIYWPLKGTDRRYAGRFRGLQGDDKLMLELEGENRVSHIPLNRFTEESVAFARLLAGSKAGQEIAAGSPEKEPEYEEWTGSNGKVLRARFMGISGGSVTLQTEDGKSYTLPLDRLDKESQVKAEGRQKQS